MPAESPRVFTIPASAPFLRTLVDALVKGELGLPAMSDPLMLADATLYLPTRRACRLARDAFLDAVESGAAILPRIVPIGDIDEDELVFADAAAGRLASTALEQPQAIDGIERKLFLAELISKWAAQPAVRSEEGVRLVAANPASILALADDLAHLMDDFTTRDASWDDLDGLVPDHLDQYWQLTLAFLKIAREQWPKLRDERGKIEPAALRDHMIAAEAERLEGTTRGPIIAAGSTGSMPSTARLLATIARLPHGAVVLPGLDTDLDAPSWNKIGVITDDAIPSYGHPQFAMHELLKKFGIGREDVVTLGARQDHGREALVSEAMRPADATERWEETLREPAFSARADKAMAGITVLQAANAEDEALGIAIALREAIDDGSDASLKRTAALITPDRALARRVLAALARWNVPVDDSGGDALAETPAGIFARLAAEVALGGVEPVPLLALMKHPLFRLGARASAHIGAIETLERAILRGPRPQPGTAGLAQALAAFRRDRDDLHPSDPRKALSDADLAAAESLIKNFTNALAPLETLARKARPFAATAMLHRDVIAALSTDAGGAIAAFSDLDGQVLLGVFSGIEEARCPDMLALPPGDYPEAFQAAMSGRIVRRPAKPESRIRILGPLEARLQQADRVVLGALVEGVWPPEPQPDPWLSRPMRRKLGLDLPERRIGLSAHDFAQSLGAKEIVLSYAAKREGSPAVPSRFVQRLAAVAGEKRWKDALERGERRFLRWARTLDEVAKPKACDRPAPKPPRDVRPMSLSVTEIEHWLRDPYTIYAKHVLKLQPIEVIDAPPGARDRGIVIHEALAEFTETFAKALPKDPRSALLAIGEKHFAKLAAYPEARAFWWPRFVRIAYWFAVWETERRKIVTSIDAEVSGRLEIPSGDRTFVLRARADRIEHLTDGSYAILDYKTGHIPQGKQVRIGLSPQMTLEAAMLRNGAFGKGSAGATLKELVYVSVKGGKDGGEALPVKFEDTTPDIEADTALARLTALIKGFDNDSQAYLSVPIPMWQLEYGDYDHLARIKEWSASGGGETAE